MDFVIYNKDTHQLKLNKAIIVVNVMSYSIRKLIAWEKKETLNNASCLAKEYVKSSEDFFGDCAVVPQNEIFYATAQ